jgi:uroporphyrinogen decarboxylase
MTSLLLKALKGEACARPPVWFMRQAGRYLPEYRDLRTRAENFVAFCLNPEMAAEATLQPMRRFPFDAAIVFADILLICQALGQKVGFEAGEGPRLGVLPEIAVMQARVEGTAETLAPVGETLTRVRAALEPERALIGFCGAPWTVACYMLDGEGREERSAARRFAYQDPETVDALLDVLVEASARYLAMQARAGADALQLFESWAEGLPDELFERLVIGPQTRLIARLRELGVTVPVIGFPRGAGLSYLAYAETVPVQGVGLDTSVPLGLGQEIQKGRTIQGSLDPLLLRAGGAELDRRIDGLKAAWAKGPWIFNLGHGILPDTPIAHVEAALKRIGAG